MAEQGQGGYIKLYRKMFTDPIWFNSSAVQKSILITLLMMAVWRPTEWDIHGKKIILQPGQFFTSRSKIKKACGRGVSDQNIRTALERFETMSFLTKQTTNAGMLISIVNWGKYQIQDSQLSQDNNQRVTNDQPTSNQPIKEEGKEVKKMKNKDKRDIERNGLFSKVDDEDLRDALTEWAEMRKKMKKPIASQQTVTRALKKLESLSSDKKVQIEIVLQSVDRCWLSFFPLKDKPAVRKGGGPDYESTKWENVKRGYFDQGG